MNSRYKNQNLIEKQNELNHYQTKLQEYKNIIHKVFFFNFLKIFLKIFD